MQEGAAALDLRHRVQVLFTTGSAIGLSDRDLLERFLYHERESAAAAFSAIVERHGPMVLRVCYQALSDRHAADDAFQATFMVLLQHARSIRKHDSMASWLFGVASRAAARIQMLEARRKRHELRRASLKPFDEANLSESPDPWSELHAGIARLPEKYRGPIILCYFEGLTHEQAAARLGWPLGTVKTRLSRARDQLRLRLRGRACGTKALVPIEHLRPPDLVGVPRHLLDTTIQAAAGFLSGTGASLVNSSSVVAIARGVSRAMLLGKLRFASIPLFGGLALGLAAIAVARQAPEKGQVLARS
jgi:HlyD family secretion protein